MTKHQVMAGAGCCAIALAAGLIQGCSAPSNPVLPKAPQDLVIKNVAIIDTHDGHVTPEMTVVIKAGRIAAIKSADESTVGDSGTLIDGTGKFLVPGFVDAHVHVLGNPHSTDEEALMLINGITGIRQMSGTPDLLRERREHRLFTSSFSPKLLAMPGEVFFPALASSPAKAAAEVDRQKAEGADFIKVGLTTPEIFYAIGSESRKVGLPFEGHLPPGVDPIEATKAGYRSIEHLGPGPTILVDCSTDEAALKLDIAAHPVHGPLPLLPGFIIRYVTRDLILDALRAEIVLVPDTMAHMQRIVETYDEAKCKNVVAAMVANGSWQTPTLIRLRTGNFADDPEYLGDPNNKYVPPETLKAWVRVSEKFKKEMNPSQRLTIEKFWELQLRLAKLFDEAGAPMLAGSDYSGIWEVAGFSLHREFDLLAQDGFTPLKVLQMTTLNPARFYGREESMGSVEVGKNADLVLLEGNPMENVKNLHRIAAVVLDGAYYPRAVLDEKLRTLSH